MSTTPYPYPYPNDNSALINTLNLQLHFEGGLFAPHLSLLSDVGQDQPPPQHGTGPGSAPQAPLVIPTSAALEGRTQTAVGPAIVALQGEQDGDIGSGKGRLDATHIYYLLTPGSYRGKMHMNLHATFHTHHAGRALYTLIRPPSKPSELPEIRRIVMGQNIANGEVPLLFVPGGWWKASEIPEEDLLLLSAPGAKEAGMEEKIGCLISEVVVPGWNPDQHQFISEDKLKAMWSGKPGWETYTKYLQPPEGIEVPDK